MKNKLYNVLFPIWVLVFFPIFWLVALPANFLIDTIVLLISLKFFKITDVEKKLVGVRYDRQAIIDALADVNIKQYIGDIDTETFVNELFA